MIYSVGIDLTDLERIGRAVERWGDRFVQRILGDKERALYIEKHDKVQFLAGRFAAKEAVMKSLGTPFDSGVYLKDIQILSDHRGKPYVQLEDTVKRRMPDREVKVSITHERKMAAAVAIIIGD